MCFSVRYAFTFSFFMIIFAARGYECITTAFRRITGRGRCILYATVCILSAFELFGNAMSVLACLGNEAKFTSYEEYERTVDVYDHLLSSENLRSDGTCGRIANTAQFSCFDGALFGYSGFSRFSSS